MAKHVLAFDLDRSLLKHVGDVLFDNKASLAQGCIVDREAADRVRQLIASGHELHIVTARSHKVRVVTKGQVAQIHPDLLKRLHMQEAWEGYDVGRQRKAKRLAQIGAAAYVGDDLMDEMAAEDAGIPFMHIDAFRAGGDLVALADAGQPRKSNRSRRSL